MSLIAITCYSKKIKYLGNWPENIHKDVMTSYISCRNMSLIK